MYHNWCVISTFGLSLKGSYLCEASLVPLQVGLIYITQICFHIFLIFINS